MNIDNAELDRECRIFATYLVGQKPSDYVIDSYCNAHRCGTLTAATTFFERALVAVANRHRYLARIADAYARFFAPRSVLRDKLVLLLALLETSAPSYRWIDDVPASTRVGTLAILVGHGTVGAACVLLGLILFTPIRLIAASREKV